MEYGKMLNNLSLNINLWLDDIRNPRDPFVKNNFGSKGDETWVKNIEEAIEFLLNGNVVYISFDNDLGEGMREGWQLAEWIEEKAYNKEILPLKWRVHSQNPVARKRIADSMENADKFWVVDKSKNS
jgi:hypothetical protein